MAIFIQHEDFVLTFLKALGNIFSIYTVEAQLFSLSLLFWDSCAYQLAMDALESCPLTFIRAGLEKTLLPLKFMQSACGQMQIRKSSYLWSLQ